MLCREGTVWRVGFILITSVPRGEDVDLAIVTPLSIMIENQTPSLKAPTDRNDAS